MWLRNLEKWEVKFSELDAQLDRVRSSVQGYVVDQVPLVVVLLSRQPVFAANFRVATQAYIRKAAV